MDTQIIAQTIPLVNLFCQSFFTYSTYLQFFPFKPASHRTKTTRSSAGEGESASLRCKPRKSFLSFAERRRRARRPFRRTFRRRAARGRHAATNGENIIILYVYAVRGSRSGRGAGAKGSRNRAGFGLIRECISKMKETRVACLFRFEVR